MAVPEAIQRTPVVRCRASGYVANGLNACLLFLAQIARNADAE